MLPRMLKLLALVPIVGVALAVNAEKVQDVVYADVESPSIEEPITEEILQDEPQPAEPEVEKADEDKKFIAEGIVFDASEDQGPISQFDENNYTPIVGAIVKVVGSKKGTVTGPDGKFKLEVSDGDDLEVMYIGYESTKIVVNKAFSEAGNKYPMPLRKESATENDAVGTFTPTAEGTFTPTAEGTFTPSDEGGSAPKAEGVFIRSTDKEPYIIIDGKPIDGAKLKDIDPKTIERMDVLKSQEAVEKYGDKAKDGVIVITTKKK